MGLISERCPPDVQETTFKKKNPVEVTPYNGLYEVAPPERVLSQALGF